MVGTRWRAAPGQDPVDGLVDGEERALRVHALAAAAGGGKCERLSCCHLAARLWASPEMPRADRAVEVAQEPVLQAVDQTVHRIL